MTVLRVLGAPAGEVRVVAAGAIGQVERFTFRLRKPPRLAVSCLLPGAAKPASC